MDGDRPAARCGKGVVPMSDSNRTMAHVRKARSSRAGGSAAGAVPRVRRLENGAVVVLDPRGSQDPDGPVSVEVWIAGGAADEGPGSFGAAHLLEHMIFKPRASGGLDLAARAERLGADINAFTSYDETVFHLVTPRSAALAAAVLLCEGVFDPRLSAGDLATERDVVLEEVRLAEDDPVQRLHERAWSRLFGPGHPYAHPILGTRASVERIAATDLRRLHRRLFVGSRAHVVVAGAVDAAALVRRVAPFVGMRPAGRRAPRRRARAEGGGRLVEWADLGEGHLLFLWQVPAGNVGAQVRWELLAQILGSGENAWLSQRLVRNTGLLSSVHAAFYPGRLGAVFAVYATAAFEDVPRAERAVPRAVAELAARGLSHAMFVQARAVLRGDEWVTEETAAGRAQAMGSHLILYGNPRAGPARRAAFAATAREAVEADLERLLQPDTPFVTGVCVRDGRMARALRRRSKPRSGPLVRARAPEGPLEPWVERLDNGVTLCAVQDPSLPVACGTVAFRAGQLVEPEELAGISVLATRCAALATVDRGAPALAEALALRCASIDPFSGRTLSGLSFDAAAPELDDVLDLVTECLAEPAFDEELVYDERRILIEEIRGRRDDLSWTAGRAALSALYGDHPFARDRLGTVTTARRLSPGVVREHFFERVAVRAPVVGIAGAFDMDRVRQCLSEWPSRRRGGRRGPRPPGVTRRPGGKTVRRARARAQTYLAIAFEAPPIGDERVVALDVAIALLGGQGGRLFQALREEEGLVYSVSVSATHNELGGHVLVRATTTPSKAQRTVARIFEVLGELTTGQVTEEAIAHARRFLVGQHAAAYERRAAVAAAMAFDEIRGLGAAYHRGYPDRLRAVDRAAILAVARETFDRDRSVTAFAGAAA